MLILLLSLLKQRIRYSDDVAAMAQGNSVLPALPQVMKQKQLPGYEFAIYQYAQVLQLRQRAGNQARTISITSLQNESGKTMLAHDLSKALSDAGLRCLLVDFSLTDTESKSRKKGKHAVEDKGLIVDQAVPKVRPRKKAYARDCDISRPGVGLKAILDAISRGSISADSWQRFMLASLHGKYTRLPLCEESLVNAKTLSGQHVAQMLEALKPHFDFIILDTAEMLKALEASLLTSLTDESFIVLNPGLKGGRLKIAMDKFETQSAGHCHWF